MLRAIDIAKYFLAQVDVESGDSLSNLKIQKLLYYAQGFQLAATGTPLFPEPIEAWAHGPAVPDIYRALKHFGSNPVDLPQDVDFDAILKPESRELLDEVYSVYGQFSAASLRNMTHDESPWKDTPQGEVIPHDLMSTFFKTRLVLQD